MSYHIKGEARIRKDNAAQHAKWMRAFWSKEIQRLRNKLAITQNVAEILGLNTQLRDDISYARNRWGLRNA